MKTSKSKSCWICMAFLLVLTGILSVRRAQPTRYNLPDEQTQLIRQLAAVNDPSLADVLEQSIVLIPAGEFIRGSDTGNYQ
jgi:hypothetical protein